MNKGAQRLSEHRSDERGALVAMARDLDIDHSYLCRLMSGERTPGLRLRAKIQKRYGIGLFEWDEAEGDAA